jgi:serine/threonine protein kinase
MRHNGEMRFGRYTVDPGRRKEGGQAFVYFANDPDTGLPVAVKVARPSEWSRRRMKREIRAHEALTHPNILPVLHRADDFSWYAAQRAECSLEELGPLPRPQWMYLRAGLLGVASAVSYAHAEGYIHRDLSAGNVLVFAHGWAVGDWGFVYIPPKTGPRMTQPLERFGTPEFMAPEVAIDPMNVGVEADVFSIGRLAAWSTGLKRAECAANDDEVVRWWRLLIDRSTMYEPTARWRMSDIETHLRTAPPALREPRRALPRLVSAIPGPAEECPHCHSAAGRDASEHCLDCHAQLAY